MSKMTETREQKLQVLLDWMIDGARPSGNAKEIVERICERLADAGVKIDRFVLFIYTLHPTLTGRRFRWIKGEPIDVAEATVGTFSQELYTSNPLPHVIERKAAIRRHLEDPDCPNDYIIVDELREQGFTDYLAQPLIFTNGETNVGTWSSRQPGGFSDEDLEILEKVRMPLARLTESYMLRLNAVSLLTTYVGNDSGEHILSGKVHRGEGEEIDAVILFTDLKDFTKLSNQKTGPELVDLLNDVFDQLVPPVVANGGEILKFMGDGFFAIFPYASNEEIEDKAKSAIDAVKLGRHALSKSLELNWVGFRSSIHFGTFYHGNVGGADRLDFTAIGPPVNYTARLLSSAESVGVDDVVSSDLAKIVGGCEKVGSANFKGFDGLQSIWKV